MNGGNPQFHGNCVKFRTSATNDLAAQLPQTNVRCRSLTAPLFDRRSPNPAGRPAVRRSGTVGEPSSTRRGSSQTGHNNVLGSVLRGATPANLFTNSQAASSSSLVCFPPGCFRCASRRSGFHSRCIRNGTGCTSFHSRCISFHSGCIRNHS